MNDAPNYEKLRQILEAEQGRKFSIEETREIGDNLVQFYQTLAGYKEVIKGTPEEWAEYEMGRKESNYPTDENKT